MEKCVECEGKGRIVIGDDYSPEEGKMLVIGNCPVCVGKGYVGDKRDE